MTRKMKIEDQPHNLPLPPVRKSYNSDVGGRAKDLHIGGRLRGHQIKELHELCPERRTPHVHVLAKDIGHMCLEFEQFV